MGVLVWGPTLPSRSNAPSVLIGAILKVSLQRWIKLALFIRKCRFYPFHCVQLLISLLHLRFFDDFHSNLRQRCSGGAVYSRQSSPPFKIALRHLVCSLEQKLRHFFLT